MVRPRVAISSYFYLDKLFGARALLQKSKHTPGCLRNFSARKHLWKLQGLHTEKQKHASFPLMSKYCVTLPANKINQAASKWPFPGLFLFMIGSGMIEHIHKHDKQHNGAFLLSDLFHLFIASVASRFNGKQSLDRNSGGIDSFRRSLTHC